MHADANYDTLYLILSDPRTFQDFVRTIRAIGGGDTPEDIMGGFKVTFTDLNWRSESCKVATCI